MRTIEENVDELVSHLLFPSEHRKRLRSTNLLERTFVEVRRRTKVIGRFPGETSALTLIWAVLELASRGWRGVTMTPREPWPRSSGSVAPVAVPRDHPGQPSRTRRRSPRRIDRARRLRQGEITRTLGRDLANRDRAE